MNKLLEHFEDIVMNNKIIFNYFENQGKENTKKCFENIKKNLHYEKDDYEYVMNKSKLGMNQINNINPINPINPININIPINNDSNFNLLNNEENNEIGNNIVNSISDEFHDNDSSIFNGSIK